MTNYYKPFISLTNSKQKMLEQKKQSSIYLAANLGYLTFTIGELAITLTPAMIRVLEAFGIDGLISAFDNVKPIRNALGNLSGLEIDGKRITLDAFLGALYQAGIEIAYGNKLITVEKATEPSQGITGIPTDNKLTTNESQLEHMFRNSEGHFIQDTPENRAMIESAASNSNNFWVLINTVIAGILRFCLMARRYGLKCGMV